MCNPYSFFTHEEAMIIVAQFDGEWIKPYGRNRNNVCAEQRNWINLAYRTLAEKVSGV